VTVLLDTRRIDKAEGPTGLPRPTRTSHRSTFSGVRIRVSDVLPSAGRAGVSAYAHEIRVGIETLRRAPHQYIGGLITQMERAGSSPGFRYPCGRRGSRSNESPSSRTYA
jgi:hypothetical protein